FFARGFFEQLRVGCDVGWALAKCAVLVLRPSLLPLFLWVGFFADCLELRVSTPASRLIIRWSAGSGFRPPGRVTFSLHAQRESNQRESAPQHPGLPATRPDSPRSGAATGAGIDGPSLAQLCLARSS